MCELISAANDDITKKYPAGVGVRANPRKVEEEPNLETQFKQEMNNPSVRDVQPKIQEETIDFSADLMIADLKQQLDDARGLVITWHDLWKKETDHANKWWKEAILQKKNSNLFLRLWRSAEDEIAGVKEQLDLHATLLGEARGQEEFWYQCSMVWRKRYKNMKEENEVLKSSRWFRFSRWLYRECNYNIYRGN